MPKGTPGTTGDADRFHSPSSLAALAVQLVASLASGVSIALILARILPPGGAAWALPLRSSSASSAFSLAKRISVRRLSWKEERRVNEGRRDEQEPQNKIVYCIIWGVREL